MFFEACDINIIVKGREDNYFVKEHLDTNSTMKTYFVKKMRVSIESKLS